MNDPSKSRRQKPWQDGTIRLRERAKDKPGVWVLAYRRYNGDGSSEKTTEIIAEQRKYPSRDEVRGSQELADLRRLLNRRNKVRSAVVSFSDLCDEYRARHTPKVRAHSQKTYSKNLSTLEVVFGDWRLDEMAEKLSEVQDWFDGDQCADKNGRPYAKSQRQQIARRLSHLFTMGTRWKHVPHNPFCNRQLEITKGARAVKRNFDIEAEMFRFLIDDRETPRHVRMMIIIAMCTGLRSEEFFALKWMDIDFRYGTINVTRTWVEGVIGLTKSEESEAVIPMAPWLARELEAYRGEAPAVEGWLFGSISTKLPFWQSAVHNDYLRPALRRMGERFGVFIPRGTGWHAFRHTYITSLDVQGSSLKVAQSLARHANPEMTLSYINKGRRHQEQMRRANRALVAGLGRTGTDGD